MMERLLFLPLFVIIAGFFLEFLLNPFRRDRRNPYIRHCKNCGQVQGEFGLTMQGPPIWYENLGGEIRNPDCRCQKHVKDCG